MITTHIRKQGGAAVMTIPASLLKVLHLPIGAEVKLDISDEGFTVKSTEHQQRRKRYSLKDLLAGATPANIKALNQATEHARTGDPVGRELL